MITKLVYIDASGMEYEVPHNNIEFRCFREEKPSFLKVSAVSSDFYPSAGGKLVLYVDGKVVFDGIVFSYSKRAREVYVLAYDRLIYFKSYDSIAYYNKTASNIILDICKHANIPTKNICDTKYVIPYVFFDNISYSDMILKALSLTRNVSGDEFFMYDRNRGINLLKKEDRSSSIVIDDVLIDYSYNLDTLSICNSAKIIKTDKFGNVSSVVYKDEDSIGKIGEFKKLVKVARDTSTAQMGQVARNYVNGSSSFSVFARIVACDILNIYDAIRFKGNDKMIAQLTLKVNSKRQIYELVLV